ncbi:MAG: hypothetical protein EAY75_13340 [Bacteroidetes bacterium]|nr:MAG: hypothetical protein EAY75_13340 [Bacteroidota bacterium]
MRLPFYYIAPFIGIMMQLTQQRMRFSSVNSASEIPLHSAFFLISLKVKMVGYKRKHPSLNMPIVRMTVLVVHTEQAFGFAYQ